MIETFYKEFLPKVKNVVAIQKEINIKEGEDSIKGYIDYILEIEGIKGPVIFDLKSAGRPYVEHQLKTSEQLKTYAASEGINKVGYIVLLKKLSFTKVCSACGDAWPRPRKETVCESCGNDTWENLPYSGMQILTTELDSKEINKTLDDYTEVVTAVNNNIVWKNPNSCMDFNTKCEFYEHCWGNKDLDKIKTLKPRRKVDE